MSEPAISSSLADFSKTEKLHSGKYFVIYRSVRKDDGLPVVLKMLKDQYPSPLIRSLQMTKNPQNTDSMYHGNSREYIESTETSLFYY